MNPDKLKALEMIQGIINRLASNSFALKAIVATVIAAAITIEKLGTNTSLIVKNSLMIIFVFIFWYLDSFYLKLEREYRNLYNYTLNQKIVNVDGSNKNNKELIDYDTVLKLYDFNLSKAEFKNSEFNKEITTWKVMWSTTEWVYYLGLAFIITVSWFL